MKTIPAGVHVTWQQQYRTCGRSYCPCGTDPSKKHGPYWTATWRKDGRRFAAYAGKQDPRPAHAAQEARHE